MRRPLPRASAREDGFALVLVLLVLLALLVLATPFLSMARDADRSSAALADRAELVLALDGASRHARHQLAASHVGIDPTPYADDLDELAADARFPAGFLDPRDTRATLWDVASEDLSGRIDLDSASPWVLANLLGGVPRVIGQAKADDATLKVSGGAALAKAGFAFVQGELVSWSSLEEGELGGLERGLLSRGEEDRGGPRPPLAHDAGEALLDQRALTLPAWRIRDTQRGRLRVLGASEELESLRLETLAAAAGLPEEAGLQAETLERFARLGSVFAGARGGPRWQRAARLTARVEAGRDGQLVVDDARWLGPGATVRVSDADEVELAVVTARDGQRAILDRVLAGDYQAYEAEVEVLVRRPVNANTAGAEVLEALFANLQLAGTTNRVSPEEARSLAALVVESRPFAGFEDFVRRVVLPSAGIEALPADAPVVPASLADGRGFLDREDALAVWLNAYDSNDADLAVSTMPLCFVSSDVHALRLSASVDSPDGALRAAALRDEVVLVAPQRELLSLWSRQEDLDEALRLSRAAPWWRTGPETTFRWDQGSAPPRPVEAQLGPLDVLRGLPGLGKAQESELAASFERVFASRSDEECWAQLWPARVEETDRLAGRVLHFDQETRHPEGRPLIEQPVVLPSDDATQGFSVGWSSSNDPLLRPLSFDAWILPRALSDGLVLDVSGPDAESDRVTLGLEGGELVLRVLDAGGDHRDSAFREAGELRYPIAQGSGPGLPLGVWSHVFVDVRGNRPDQMTLLVNGLAHGVRALGATRLTGGLSADSPSLTVESTEGFPQRCALRIGFEIVEAEVTGPTSFRAIYNPSGAAAGFGGRSARVRFSGAVEPDVPLSPSNEAYPPDTPVELYGYSLPLVGGGAPAGEAVLTSGLGPFRVARCIGAENPSTAEGDAVQWGFGYSALGVQGGGTSTVSGLFLADGDVPGSQDVSFAEAFDRRGGYAAVVQGFVDPSGSSNVPVGGVEIVRYSTWELTQGPHGEQAVVLRLAARGNAVAAALPNYAGANAPHLGGTRAFVTNWNGITAGGVDLNTVVAAGVYVLPISLSVPNQAPGIDFLPAEAGLSEFAQITETQQPELSEWVRYDWIEPSAGQLVRDAPQALDAVYREIVRLPTLDPAPNTPGNPGGGGQPPNTGGGLGGTGGAGGNAGGGGGGGASALVLAAPAAPQQQSGAALWVPERGALEPNYASAWPLSRAVLDVFQFRGVLGTHAHAHAAGARVHPVFSVRDLGPDGGRPGAYDRVFVIDESPTHVGWPVTVHRAVLPPDAYVVHHWDPATNVPLAGASEVVRPARLGFDPAPIRVALQDKLPEPIAASDLAARADPRMRGRLTCFPSGERPRGVTTVAVGGSARAAQSAVPDLVADELVFADVRFGARGTVGGPNAGAQLELVEDLASGAGSLHVYENLARIPGELVTLSSVLAELPEDGGLLKLGEEILAYEARDPASGLLTLAPGGRGLLGTREVPHQAGEPASFLERYPVSVLSAQVGADDARLPLASVDGFPRQGTALVGDELVHYAALVDGSLWMPSRSSEPGARDGRGGGLFRGRFGTPRTGHGAGEVVVGFPFRYWDRWAERADAPELAWLGLEVEQPAAFWRSFFFDAEESPGGVRAACLARSDPQVPWDADPARTEGLRLTRVGTERGEPLALGGQSGRLELRFFAEFPAGAFDLATGSGHAWRQTPRLVRAGAFYLAPSLTLRTLDR